MIETAPPIRVPPDALKAASSVRSSLSMTARLQQFDLAQDACLVVEHARDRRQLIGDRPVVAVDQHAGAGGIEGHGRQDIEETENDAGCDAGGHHPPLPAGSRQQVIEIDRRTEGAFLRSVFLMVHGTEPVLPL